MDIFVYLFIMIVALALLIYSDNKLVKFLAASGALVLVVMRPVEGFLGEITDKSIEYGLPPQTQFSTTQESGMDKDWKKCPSCVSASKIPDNEYIDNPEAAFAAELYRYESQPSADDLRNADAPCATSFARAFTTNERALDFGLDISPDIYLSGDYLTAADGITLKQLDVGQRNKRAIDGAVANTTTERFRNLYEAELRENDQRIWWEQDNYA